MKKLNKIQKERINFLLNSNSVDNFHKTLLKGIKGTDFKNVSIADNSVLIDLFNKYNWVEEWK